MALKRKLDAKILHPFERSEEEHRLSPTPLAPFEHAVPEIRREESKVPFHHLESET